MRKGIDVSTYQKQIDWQKVKESGIEFAMIKAGQGRSEIDPQISMFRDSEFLKHVDGATSVGIDVGAYYYLTAQTTEEAEKEAIHIVSIINKRRDKINLYAAVDVESKLLPVDKKLLTEIVKRFCAVVRENGYTDIIYTNHDFLSNRINNIPDSRLWLALWRDETIIPSIEQYPNVRIWQYGADNVSGIYGNVDCNIEIVSPKECELLKNNNPKDWSSDAVSWAVNNGLAIGNENGDLMLDKSMTREEMFVLLNRFYNKFIQGDK